MIDDRFECDGGLVEPAGRLAMIEATLMLVVQRRWLPRCGRCYEPCRRVHEQLAVRRWEDLPWGSRPVVLEYAPVRVKCDRCNATPVDLVTITFSPSYASWWPILFAATAPSSGSSRSVSRLLTLVAARDSGAIVARFDKVPDVTSGFYRPTWTPDGRIVVAGGFGNQGLFVSDVGLTQLTRFDPMVGQAAAPAVSPDGTKVAFVLNTRVYVIGIDGQGLTPLAPEDNDGDDLPTWSPDGTSIAYVSGGHLHVKPAGGGAAQDFFDLYPQFQNNHPVFAPSGQFNWS